MILRLAAAASMALGTTLLLLYLGEIGKAPWSDAASRHLRDMKERTALPAAYTPTTFAATAALPRFAPLATYAPFERQAVTLEGYVQRITRAPDGDIHLDFADTLDTVDHALVPYLSCEITPQWHRGSPRWRYERLLALFRPMWNYSTQREWPPVRVRLSGWRTYDYPYDGEQPTYGFPMHLAMWEIHPVTRIEAWDAATARFVELPR
ncbi:MAG TPA: hypothetical protein VL123_02455 [Candidatus Udaeobacter sp.]|nr:hypothetical protein [Candidatus Udaeobacter sp.]